MRLTILIFVFFQLGAQAQFFRWDPQSIFVSWGYNRAFYDKSNISVKGPNLNLLFEDVIAVDDPEPFSENYYRLDRFTIPQFDFRIGVKLPNNLILSWGWEHMKYMTKFNSKAKLSGYIGDEYFNGYYPSNESIQDDDYRITRRFFYTEHTDGLNYLNFELEQYLAIPIWEEHIQLHLNYGLGTGPMMPWSDSYLFGKHYRNPSIHFAGWGVNLKTQVGVQIGKRFQIIAPIRLGYLNLWDILLSEDIRAKQSIRFLEYNFSFSWIFPLR
ncbi:hypothetical protein [Luteibaculum oceani]|uniref:Uncharacterized protein n=1 Tax=Luteibaculum oceani TaxID=1294296 RepID=A0A5C6VJ14_9FLAO|nr:hypothetical protein [Luteibaculum oceani]TXC85177.1 hypothetical protein FRX97_00725 [Luteibaculum oceani]